MTDITAKLDVLEAVARAATPGPWHCRNKVGYVYGPDCVVAVVGDFRDKTLAKFSADRWNADAQLIASIDPPTVLALIAVARAVEAVVPPESAIQHASLGWQAVRQALSSLSSVLDGVGNEKT